MWRQWSEETLGEARERDLPILLLVTARGCPRSAVALSRLEPQLGRLSDRYVCVHATRERDAAIDARHRGAGWPALVALDAGGRNGRPLELSELLPEGEGDDMERFGAPSAGLSGPLAGVVEAVTDTLVSSADPVWGGWGKRQKFPHPDALHFLLVRWSQTGRDDLLEVVLRTLKAVERQPIHDAVEGGFYRFATEPDWTAPDYEKPLLSNAKRMLAFAEAHQALGHASFRATSEGVARWMMDTLHQPEPRAFGGSQDADPAYARLASRELRSSRGRPPIDPTIHADRNAWAAIAFFKAGCVFEDEAFTGTGLAALQFLVEHLFDPVRGVSHYWNGTWNQPGDLRDQAAVLRAAIEAVHYAGAGEYLAVAEAIAAWTEAHLDAGDGTFLTDPYAQRVPVEARPADDLRWNAMMAEALLRLGVLTRDRRWVERGARVLSAWSSAWRPHGFAAAGYARALVLLMRGPVHVMVVGSRDDPRTRALVRAALRPYIASRVVQTLDPALDVEQLTRLGFGGPLGAELPTVPTAIAEQGGRTYAITDDATRLPALLAGSERD